MAQSKMKWFFLYAGIAVLLGGVLAGAAQTPASQRVVREIHMTAKRFQFDPSVIVVHKGDRVKLIITAVDHDHGIALPAFGIKQKLKKGVAVTIVFDANKTGVFPFHCSVFCGLGHRRMKGQLVVKAK